MHLTFQANAGSSLKSWTVEDRALTLDDTQGMFLLLAMGFTIGSSFFVSEWLGGCFNFCKKRRRGSNSSIESNPRSHDTLTPRQKLDSLKCNNLHMEKIPDEDSEQNNVSVDVEINHNHTQKENGTREIDLVDEKDDQENHNSLMEVNYLVSEIDRIFNFEEMFGTSFSSSEKDGEEIDAL